MFWYSGLGNYFVCKRFAVQTLLWLIKFFFQTCFKVEVVQHRFVVALIAYESAYDMKFRVKLKDNYNQYKFSRSTSR